MTYNLIFEIVAEEDGELPKFTGNIVRAIVLKLISDINQELAQELHDSNEIKPYAVAPIMLENWKYKRRNEGLVIKKGYKYILRFSILGKLADKLLSDIMERTVLKEFKIGNLSFIANSMKIEMFEDKIKVELEPDAKVEIDVEFITPTAFSTTVGKFNIPLPIPEYLIGNLANLYESFEHKLENRDDLIQWTKSNMYIMQHKIRTENYSIGKSVDLVGFVGNIKYCIHPGKYRNSLINLLIYGCYSNTGIKRTTGMGLMTVRSIKPLK